jgi:capsular polysaccharide biosynthesis protein
MEFREYLKILKKNFLLIFILGIAGFLVSFVTVKKLPTGYEKSQLVYVVIPKIAQNQTYNFEGYFSQEKARNFTDTAIAILESPDFSGEILTPGEALNIRKVAPQVIRITAVANDSQSADSLITKTITGFNQKMFALTNEDQQPQIKLIGKSQPAVFTGQNPKIITAFGFLAGVFFAIFVISLKTFLKL